MKELLLKYGCNPNQIPARVFTENGELPIAVLNGQAGYINLLDALNGWQLVKELKEAAHLPAAASFKHVSPAGAAAGLELTETLKKTYFTGGIDLSPLACAYARARGADRMSSFGDFIALSDECDEPTARLIAKEVSDGIIAPSYSAAAFKILSQKKKGAYCIIQIDKDYAPPAVEKKQVFGITFEQARNNVKIDGKCLTNLVSRKKTLSPEDERNLIFALIMLKYTQSNSVCLVKDGQAIGIGAGQQSRIHCTRLASDKADKWHLRQHPKVLALQFADGTTRQQKDNAIDSYIGEDFQDFLNGSGRLTFQRRPEPLTQQEKDDWLSACTGAALGSDAFFPFGDNVERAHKSGVTAIAEPGGSIRDDDVIAACDKYKIALAFTGIRLFHH